MKQVVLKHALHHRPVADDFAVIDAAPPACPDDGVVAQVLHISLDPYVGSRLRGRHMGEAPPAPMTDMIPGGVIARIVQSRTPHAREGDLIHTTTGGWAEAIALPHNAFRRIDPKIAPLAAYLGVLGMPGLTAWAGVTQLAQVKPGDVFLVDAAAGPVGGTAGQIARLRGAKRIVGIAGGAEKCRLVVERYGFDACIDSKSADWLAQLDAALGEAPSVHFENVGMNILLPVMQRLKLYGRVVLCGLVDQYHADAPPPQIPAGLIVGKRAQMLGLVVYDFYPRFAEFIAQTEHQIADGSVRFMHDQAFGLEAAPAHFEKLMRGDNIGKTIVTLVDDPA
jgi:hypothetical protein